MNREREKEKALEYIQEIQDQIREIEASDLTLKTKKDLIERLAIDMENFYIILERMESAEAAEQGCGCGCHDSSSEDDECCHGDEHEGCCCEGHDHGDEGCCHEGDDHESQGCCGGHHEEFDEADYEDEEAVEIQVLVLSSEEPPLVAIIPDTFEALYEIMGSEELVMERMQGHEEYIMILNPEDQSEENKAYVGTIIICRVDENNENLDSLNDEDIENLLEMFR